MIQTMLRVLSGLLWLMDVLGKVLGSDKTEPADPSPEKPSLPDTPKLEPLPDESIIGEPSTPIPGPPVTTPPRQGQSQFQRLLDLHNQERMKAGVPPLKEDSFATLVARQQAVHMASNSRLTHDRPRGGSLAGDFKDKGVRFSLIAENVAMGYGTQSAVHAGWMASRGHRANILRPGLTLVGFAAATGRDKRIYWATVFYSK